MRLDAVGRQLKTRPRFMASLAAAVLVALLVPVSAVGFQTTRLLIAWNTGTIMFLVLAAFMFARSSTDSMLQRAKMEDEGAWVVLVLVVVAALTSVVAIVAELATVKNIAEADKAGHIALAGLTVFSSWAFTHTMFAMHYAHNFYLRQDGPEGHGGLSFPTPPGNPDTDSEDAPDRQRDRRSEPDYLDFLYFSFIIGTSAQTADVSFTSKQMRRLGTLHCILSFLFNTAIVALCINIGASLI
jgi:uncharacterized membrane protein